MCDSLARTLKVEMHRNARILPWIDTAERVHSISRNEQSNNEETKLSRMQGKGQRIWGAPGRDIRKAARAGPK